MNICKSVVVVVPETNLKYEVRIDLVKAKLLQDGRIGWHHLGVNHIAANGTKIGAGRLITTIQGVKPQQMQHGSCTYLVTQSRIAANALYDAWHAWAKNEARLQEQGYAQGVRFIPQHSHYWHL